MANATDNLMAAEKIIKGIMEGPLVDKALEICRWLLSLNNEICDRSHKIKCYRTGGNKPDIRFCLDRGSDCEGAKIRTGFLVIEPDYALMGLYASSPDSYTYFRPDTDKRWRIGPKDVSELSITTIKEHILESYCFKIKDLGLAPDLCNFRSNQDIEEDGNRKMGQFNNRNIPPWPTNKNWRDTVDQHNAMISPCATTLTGAKSITLVMVCSVGNVPIPLEYRLDTKRAKGISDHSNWVRKYLEAIFTTGKPQEYAKTIMKHVEEFSSLLSLNIGHVNNSLGRKLGLEKVEASLDKDQSVKIKVKALQLHSSEHSALTNQGIMNEGDNIMSDATELLDNIEFEDTDEYGGEEQFSITSAKRRIFTDQGDLAIDYLYGKYKKGKLVIQPDFQRHFVWDSKKASRLIESVLLEIPLPVVYLAEGNDGKEYVVDGQQRLTSFFSFIDGKLPDYKDFKLTSLEVFSELNKKSFKEIEEHLQDKIRDYKIRVITFKKESEKDLRFEIFERLNTGAVPLNDQELRNCTYRGRYNELLKELSIDKDFMYVLGLSTQEKRMRDVELVLRFAAFYHSTYLKYKSPIKKFLNQDMVEYDNLSDAKAAELKAAFKNSVSIIRSLLDNCAFKRFHKGDSKHPDGHWESKKFNAALYDMLMYSFSEIDKNRVYPHLDAIREALINLMTTDDEFISLIEISTSAPQSVIRRFDKWRKTLQDIVGIQSKEPRCFSYRLKEQLYKTDPTCLMCNQRIAHIDDAAVDHIEQYWLGGKTIPDNARLSHRFCNATRPRKEN